MRSSGLSLNVSPHDHINQWQQSYKLIPFDLRTEEQDWSHLKVPRCVQGQCDAHTGNSVTTQAEVMTEEEDMYFLVLRDSDLQLNSLCHLNHQPVVGGVGGFTDVFLASVKEAHELCSLKSSESATHSQLVGGGSGIRGE